MATEKEVSRILSMVDLCGGTPEKKTAFIDVVKKTLPPQVQNRDRYVTMFEGVVKTHISSAYVTDKKSILPCVFQAVKFGLDPDPSMGLIYFIPYKGKLTYQIGYKGMIKLAKNSGNIVDVRSIRVLEGDIFEYFEDEKGQHFKYSPIMQEHDRAEIACISIVQLKTGESIVQPMASDHIEKIKKMVLSRTPNSPWANPLFEPEMRKKTAIRRHLKTQDCSPELAVAIEAEEAVERGDAQEHKAAEIDAILDRMEVVTEEIDEVENLKQLGVMQ
jgi:recombination protein RecT